MPKLIYKDPDTGSQVVVELDNEQSEVTVGRNPGNIIRINNPSVSRRHTKLIYEHGQVSIYDLNSSNGTYVNGMRIEEQVLDDGDLVRVGEFPMEFVDDVEAPSTQVEDGSAIDAQQNFKSTHMGVGAMGMGGGDDGDEPGRGGAMAPTAGAAAPDPDSGVGLQMDGAMGQEATEAGDDPSAEFILGEDDIEEVIEPEDEEHAAVADDGFSDDTVQGGAEIAASVDAMQSESQFDGGGGDDDAQTRRADASALSLAEFDDIVDGDSAEEIDDEAIAGLRQQVAELRAELEKAPSPDELERVAVERDEAQRRVGELEEEVAERDQQLESAQQDVADLEASVDDLRQQLQERDQEVEELEDRLEVAENEAGGSDDELEVKVQQQEAELEKLRQEVAAFDEEREEKKAIFKELSGDLRELVAGNKELKAEVENLRDERDALMETVEALEDESAGAPSAAGSSQDYQQLVEEKESLEETLAEVILERDRLEDELSQAREAS